MDRHIAEAKHNLGLFLLLSAAAGPSGSHVASLPASAVELHFSGSHLIDACKHYNEAKRIEHIINGTSPIIKYDGPIIK